MMRDTRRRPTSEYDEVDLMSVRLESVERRMELMERMFVSQQQAFDALMRSLDVGQKRLPSTSLTASVDEPTIPASREEAPKPRSRHQQQEGGHESPEDLGDLTRYVELPARGNNNNNNNNNNNIHLRAAT